MYSTLSISKTSKRSGNLVGTHQLLDRAARKVLARQLKKAHYFPSAKEILEFEGSQGPDGLKRKSPDDDDPSHMFGDGDGAELFQQIEDHYYNLVQALKTNNRVRASFEAAWLAHKVTDGLTPAHHFPLSEAKDELMTNKEFVKILGEPIKGIMHGRNLPETMRNNWLYWGASGYMSKHVAYEYGVALIGAVLPTKTFLPKLTAADFANLELRTIFYGAITRIKPAIMYQKFRTDGWTNELAFAVRDTLLPEIIRAIVLVWLAAYQEAYRLGATSTPVATKPARKVDYVNR